MKRCMAEKKRRGNKKTYSFHTASQPIPYSNPWKRFICIVIYSYSSAVRHCFECVNIEDFFLFLFFPNLIGNAGPKS